MPGLHLWVERRTGWAEQEQKLPTRNPEKWWRRTRLQAWAAAGAILFASVIGVVLANSPGRQVLLFLPIAQFAGLVLVPLAIVVLTHFLTKRQESLDRDHSVWEDS